MEVICLPLVDVPEYTGFQEKKGETKVSFETKGKWEGDQIGLCVGRIYQDGRVESGFKVDKESSTTEIFDKLRNDVELVQKKITVLKAEREIVSATDYYIPYKVENHCSSKPTVVENYVDCVSNLRYKVTYEVLLVAGEGFTRYLVFDYTTCGTYSTSFYNQVEELRDKFDEMFENQENDFRMEDGEREVAFYDRVGEKLYIDIYSTGELLDMIASIRVIGLETEIIEER